MVDDSNTAPRPASRADEVTDIDRLIEQARVMVCLGLERSAETKANGDLVVLALRLLRVMRHPRALNVYFDSGCYWVRFKPRSTAEGTPGHPLDDAERILGIVAGDGEGGGE